MDARTEKSPSRNHPGPSMGFFRGNFICRHKRFTHRTARILPMMLNYNQPSVPFPSEPTFGDGKAIPETARIDPVMTNSALLTRSPSAGEKVPKKIAQQWTPPHKS